MVRQLYYIEHLLSNGTNCVRGPFSDRRSGDTHVFGAEEQTVIFIFSIWNGNEGEKLKEINLESRVWA